MVPVSDYDKMLLTPKYMAYADAYMEFVMIGALLGPALFVLWTVGIIRYLRNGDKRLRGLAFTSTAVVFMYLAQHFSAYYSQLYSEQLLGRGQPYGFGTLVFSFIRWLTYFAVITLFIDPALLGYPKRKGSSAK